MFVLQGANSKSVWVPLPCKFSTWDTDKDGSISLAEFAFAGHTKTNGSNTGKMFKRVDKDGNYIQIKIYYENHSFTENV